PNANPPTATESPVPQPPKTLPSSAVRFLIKPAPVYSQASQELGESGTVTMMILVDEQGRAKEVQVSKSSGYPRLDRAAVAAERAARFQPHLEAGVPRSVWVPHSITFNLDER
ncbi:MAG: energy transducer TonB, partial [Rubrivivax sp.]